MRNRRIWWLAPFNDDLPISANAAPTYRGLVHLGKETWEVRVLEVGMVVTGLHDQILGRQLHLELLQRRW
jgi:hypothetical protein